MPKYFALRANPTGFAKKYPLPALAALILLWFFGLYVTYLTIHAAAAGGVLGQDAHAYWLAGQGELVYDKAPRQRDAYLYSPAFLAVIRPFAMLPWLVFLPLWICLEAAVLVWLLKPLQAKWSIPIFLFCVPELIVGNIHILLAAAAVVGLKKPVAWSFPILTKVTAGVGLLWFVVRGEWRQVLKAATGLSLIVAVSYLLDPAGWQAWVEFLFAHRSGAPDSQTGFLVRCALAVGLVVLGARKQWPWLIAPAMILASPVLWGLIPFSMVAAIPRLTRLSGQDAELPGSRLSGEALTAPAAKAARTH